jgi:hypothetical protein
MAAWKAWLRRPNMTKVPRYAAWAPTAGREPIRRAYRSPTLHGSGLTSGGPESHDSLQDRSNLQHYVLS